MDPKLAARMGSLRASDIREILKVTQNRDIISFAGGLPAPELFPTDRIAELATEVIRTDGTIALQYSPTEGYQPLREKIAARMNRIWKTRFVANEILLTTGSQQGLDLSAKLFLDDGDIVLCESPSYLGALMSFNTFRPRYIEVPTDDEGMDMEVLEEQLRTHERARIIYTVPTFQNPSGRTWSLARRKRLVELAAKYTVAVIEDNPYGELWYDTPPPACLETLDEAGNVVFLGTFSKIFCPGLRLGWIAAKRGLLDKFVVLKQGSDLHTSTFDQMILSRYLETYDIDIDLVEKRDTYRRRRNAMIQALEREMPEGVHFTRPGGGLFLWVEVPGNINTRDLLTRCLERGVAFVPGEPFFPATKRKNAMRLNFSNMPEERIMEGVQRLGSELRAMLRGERSLKAAEAGK